MILPPEDSSVFMEVFEPMVKNAPSIHALVPPNVPRNSFKLFSEFRSEGVDIEKPDELSAEKIFGSVRIRDVVSWTSIIMGLAQHGRANEALSLSQSAKIDANITSLSFVTPKLYDKYNKLRIKLYSKLCLSIEGKCHAYVIKTGLDQHLPLYPNTLIYMYGKCSHMKDAVKLFDEMLDRDLASWASIFTAHNQANLPWQTLFLFSHMRSREGLQPDHFIFACLVKACACLSASKLGLQLHAQFVLSHFSDEDVVNSSLVYFYAKCGLPDQASKVFHSIVSKNVVSWTSLVYGYARIERKNKALEHLHDMPYKNVHSWTTPISCFVQGGHCTNSFKIFNELRREDIDIEEPFVLSSLIVGSSSLAMLELGKQVHKLVIVLGYESNSYISNALIDMYDKCSDVLSAEKIFGSLRRRDVVSWTSTIVGLAQHGRAIEALSLCTDGS
ncbi:hypothetical protein ABFX02_05G093950 [Erythranthe guttata]